MEKEVLKPYVPKAPFPQRLKGVDKEKKFSSFLDFKSLHVNIPFIEALQQMLSYIKCMKELLTKKNSLKGGQTIMMTKECSALIQKDLPTKKKDPGSFHISCAIGDTMIDIGFCDIGASINLMPLSLVRKLQINELKPINIILQLADKIQKQALGVVENVLVKVGRYFLSTDFVILKMEENYLHPIILGQPFLATAKALIDVEKGELMLRIHDEQLTFHVFNPSHDSKQENKGMKDDHEAVILEKASNKPQAEPLKASLGEKQEIQVVQQSKRSKEGLEPQDSKETISKDPLDTKRSTT
ncbi:uncharacterized protein LOC107465869 [Arachis duranensis]|uniref:Uncharacterized protein LOC107465869 n=1 Tax=Arachis duranensis TaxID=130453 RepID=A0A6P4BN25_ARADU|nr:uncharacterized protein LOC107465869 [Arachis duranensis]